MGWFSNISFAQVIYIRFPHQLSWMGIFIWVTVLHTSVVILNGMLGKKH